MAPTRSAVHIQGGDFMAVYQKEKKLEDLVYLPPLVGNMLDDLAWWAGALKTARDTQNASTTGTHWLDQSPVRATLSNNLRRECR